MDKTLAVLAILVPVFTSGWSGRGWWERYKTYKNSLDFETHRNLIITGIDQEGRKRFYRLTRLWRDQDQIKAAFDTR